MRLKGFEIFWESLIREGVEVVFGLPGGAVISIYHAYAKYRDRIKHILVRHEQAAVHAADGYARSTGRPGVALVTSGPGATNTVTGIATSYMDSSPVVVFTGQVPTSLIGMDAFQEADIVGITRPCTKHNYIVKSTEELAKTIKEAFYIARTGRPGPVLVDIPRDVSTGEAEFEYPESVYIRSYNPNIKGHPYQVKKAVDAIVSAKRPVIYAGGGINWANAYDELKMLVEIIQVPVALTLMGLGAFPGDHELFLGMLGMHGTYAANMAVTECDLLIAIGVRFDDRVTGKVDDFARDAIKIHIDIDPASISKNVIVDIPIVGDAKVVLSQLLDELRERKNVNWYEKHKEWLERVKEWKKKYPLKYENSDEVIKPQYVMEVVSELTQGNAYICTDVGQHQMWAAQFIKHKYPRHFITSGGLGTMGFGFPAAIGVQAAHPDDLVIDIAGDGSIQMNIQELATVKQYNLPVKVVIINNGYLGMVRQWQELFFDRVYSETDISVQPDFVRLAEAYGVKGLRATKPAELEKVLTEAFEHKGPVVVDVHVDREENVLPMVPAGGSIRNMILAPPRTKEEDDRIKEAKPLDFPS
ncbi:MAG: biosynthetic-type acetolactate synthase large subunit [Thermosulfidibacteraceae bacterium]|jgi:acetolactate synthase-1/2/3 large subunit